MNFLENNVLRNTLIDSLKKEKITDTIKRQLTDFSILKYHFTFGDHYLFIDYDKRREIYKLHGTYFFKQFSPVGSTSKDFIYCISQDVRDCKILFIKMVLEFMEYQNVMY